jgi:hypothetical protein
VTRSHEASVELPPASEFRTRLASPRQDAARAPAASRCSLPPARAPAAKPLARSSRNRPRTTAPTQRARREERGISPTYGRLQRKERKEPKRAACAWSGYE